MTNTFVITHWKNFDKEMSEKNPVYNLKVSRGFLLKESRRTNRRLIRPFSGKTIESLVEFCRKENIAFGEGPLKDYITTPSNISVQAGHLSEGVCSKDLLRFYQEMNNIYSKK